LAGKLVLVQCFAGAAALSALAGAAVAPETFAQVDDSLRAAKWEAARTSALEQVDTNRATLYAPVLAGAVARLAVAEAGLAQTEEAEWHWQIAQNLDRAPLSAEELTSFGKPGTMLRDLRLRQRAKPPAGITVDQADSAPGLQPPRKVAGEPVELSAAAAQVPIPKGLLVEVVVDADGRVRAPVVIGSAAPGMVWETLEALRGWRYEPARKGGRAVAVFHELRFNAPAPRLLADVVALDGPAIDAEKSLRAGQWREARRQAREAWNAELEQPQPRRESLAASLALLALADAGLGDERPAICRWQAAQHLDERLYGMDVAAYGAAGVLLGSHRWGTAPRADAAKAAEPPRKKDRTADAGQLTADSKGVVLIAATVDERGGIQQPLILGLGSGANAPVSRLGAAAGGTLDPTSLGAVAGLDHLCGWTFAPARAHGRPVVSDLLLTVGFGHAAWRGAAYSAENARSQGPPSLKGSSDWGYWVVLKDDFALIRSSLALRPSQ
jgi:hypothetical protein